MLFIFLSKNLLEAVKGWLLKNFAFQIHYILYKLCLLFL